MSRKGDCYDNALMESFFGTFKEECVERQTYQTRAEARTSVFEYIEIFYNRQRKHSSLGYVSPTTYEQMKGATNSRAFRCTRKVPKERKKSHFLLE